MLPAVTGLVAAALAARVGGSTVRRATLAKPFWAVGLLLFAIAAAAEAYGVATGWSAPGFRVYYLVGGCLCVAVLGVGSAFQTLPRPAALVLAGAVAASCVAATVGVLLERVDPVRLAAAHGLAPPVNATLGGHAFLWAIALNVVGTSLLGGAALASIARRRNVRGNALIVAGVVAVAGSGSLTRLGSYGLVFVGQIVAVALLAAGFELSSPARPRRSGGLLGVSEARSRPTAS
jgi:hypothetical protein